MVIFMFRGPVRVIIVLMILTEIFRSLSLCSRGYDHFKGSNLLLQLWVLEHFYQRQAENDVEADLHNKIRSHARRLSMGMPQIMKMLIELEGFQPYIPLRVLRQFGISQDVPLWLNMTLVEVDYKERIPSERISALIQGWYDILDLGMVVKSWCTPEYYTWFMMEGILARLSCDGILGFTDTQRSNQIGTELLNLMHITTTMYHQVTPQSVDHLIQAVDDEPNEKMKEDPEEDPREPIEEMEDDSK
ncbi:hypothetical protein KY285_007693 [Solanum tuberosum]|nr:hypothetical protein KY285_007693 [Solanum tuberosum]